MKRFTRALAVLLPLLLPTFAAAQAPPVQPNMFSHIIIVVQENRTPDNLFGYAAATTAAGCSTFTPFMSGLDITNGGPSKNATTGVVTPVCNTADFLQNWYASGNNPTGPDTD
jgi:phospholipase C